MNKNDEKWRELFKLLPAENLSPSFDDRLMRKIARLAAVKAKKKKALSIIFTVLGTIGGLAGLVSLLWFLFSHFGVKLSIPQLSLTGLEFKLPTIELPAMFVMLAIVVLLLLSADMLVRRYRLGKKEKNM